MTFTLRYLLICISFGATVWWLSH